MLLPDFTTVPYRKYNFLLPLISIYQFLLVFSFVINRLEYNMHFIEIELDHYITA